MLLLRKNKNSLFVPSPSVTTNAVEGMDSAPAQRSVSVRGEDQSLRRVFPCALTLLSPRCVRRGSCRERCQAWWTATPSCCADTNPPGPAPCHLLQLCDLHNPCSLQSQALKQVTPYNLQFSTDYHTQRMMHASSSHNPETARLHAELAWMPGSSHGANPLATVSEASLYGGKM